MLAKQPLRYLLADDPGAGKTIMTGLLIKELMIRGDLHRCLIVSPGNLVEQWQDELNRRFHIVFDILTNDRLEASASGNAFTEMPLCIARLDKLSRDEYTQEKLRQTEWDLIVVDEAHKMSTTFFGGEVRYTKRYQLGEVLGKITRHLLLLTATPHSGIEGSFRSLLGLLNDRFENIDMQQLSEQQRRVLDELVLEPGAFYVMDRGYVDFRRLYQFVLAASYFVTRTKSGIQFNRLASNPVDRKSGVRSGAQGASRFAAFMKTSVRSSLISIRFGSGKN